MDPVDTFSHYVPAQVAQALLAQGGKLEPVETEATILMCDIEGFAALTDALGPRGIFDFLNVYFERLVSIVERHGGVVTQFQGDAILAAFNVPGAAADHAARALRAALEIVRTCDAEMCAGAPVRNRIGISTGQVVAGAVGSHGRLSYTVHGNPVNLAARLEAEQGLQHARSADGRDRSTLPGLRAAQGRRRAGARLRGESGALHAGRVRSLPQAPRMRRRSSNSCWSISPRA